MAWPYGAATATAPQFRRGTGADAGVGGGDVSCSIITASFERKRNGDRCLKVFSMPFVIDDSPHFML